MAMGPAGKDARVIRYDESASGIRVGPTEGRSRVDFDFVRIYRHKRTSLAFGSITNVRTLSKNVDRENNKRENNKIHK